jgi:hypothetical protein
VEGKPRPCGDRVEAFVVVPSVGVAPAPEAGPPEPEADEPEEAPEPASSVGVEDDPYLEPTPEPPAPEPPPEIPPEEQPFELRARAGPDFCLEVFYKPAEAQRNCDDTDLFGFGIELDAGFHFEEWFLTGVMVGYRYFGSQVDSPTDNVEEKKNASNHVLQLGWQFRLSWMLEEWVLGVDGVPVGISHQVIGVSEYQDSVNEFFVTISLSAAYRVGKASWVGAYAEILQLMPWVDSANYRPAIITVGVLVGTRLGPEPEAEAAEEEPEGEDEGGDALMRRRLGDI